MIMGELSSDESLDFQEQLLIEDGCSLVDEADQAGCEEGVKTWWRRMAQVVYTNEATHQICHGLDPHCHLHGFDFEP